MLIVTSLVVILLLLSTIVCVSEVEKNSPIFYADSNKDLVAIKQAAANTIISAIANISNGGNPTIISNNLNRLKSVISDNSYNSLINFNFTISNTSPYTDGVLISWNSDGEGISSISVDFSMNTSGISSNYYTEYSITKATLIKIEGFNIVKGTDRTVTVTSTLFNEGMPALSKNFLVYYQQKNPTIWVEAPSSNTIDYGNGTYTTSFIIQKQLTENSLPVSIYCQDTRGVVVMANTTCPQQ